MGAGLVVCEIQEYSDPHLSRLRFGRVDSSGKPREVHIEKALEVTDFSRGARRQNRAAGVAFTRRKEVSSGRLRIFATERWIATGPHPLKADSEEFQLFGDSRRHRYFYDGEQAHPYRPGEAWFLPANLPTTR